MSGQLPVPQPSEPSWERFTADPRRPRNADVRVGHADRDLVADLLGDAYAVGKLDTVEYNERLLASSILFLIAGTVVALNVVIWLLASISARELLYFWPMWVAVGMVVPVVIGAALRRSAD